MPGNKTTPCWPGALRAQAKAYLYGSPKIQPLLKKIPQ